MKDTHTSFTCDHIQGKDPFLANFAETDFLQRATSLTMKEDIEMNDHSNVLNVTSHFLGQPHSKNI